MMCNLPAVVPEERTNAKTYATSVEVIHEPVEAIRVRRGQSLDSLRALDNLDLLSAVASLKLMPPWLGYLLYFGGGCSGHESILAKMFVFFCGALHVVITGLAIWLIGLPLAPECLVCEGMGLSLVWATYITRWRILGSGILWSLAEELDKDGKVISGVNKQSRLMLLTSPFEAVLFNSVFLVIGFVLDPSGNAESLMASGRMCCGVALVVNMLLYFQYHCAFNAVPLLFWATCKLLQADISHFQSEVDMMFAEEFGESDKQVRQRLQQLECALRTRQVAINHVFAPGITCFISIQAASIIGIIILSIRAHAAGTPTAIYIFYAIILALMFGGMLALLYAAACVGDRWVQLLDDLNTPELCSSTTRVLGVSLAERLQLLKNVGVQVFGVAVTSQTLLNVSISVVLAMFLTVVGTMLQAP